MPPHLLYELSYSRLPEMIDPQFQERWSLGTSQATTETQTQGSQNHNYWEGQLGNGFRDCLSQEPLAYN